MRAILVAFAMWVAALSPAWAQERVWIQIEAHQSLRDAETRLRGFAATLPDVSGFRQGSQWYAIALGPYTRPDAEARLQTLRAARDIPRDSFLVAASGYRSQFWPVGANDLVEASVITATPEAPTPAPEVEVAEEAPVGAPDETVREARASERLLTRPEREELQIALRWAGFYRQGIDGAFGRGTRGAMQAYQEARGFEPTGVLTTAQRAALIGEWNAVFDGLDMRDILDEEAGIQIQMPWAKVERAEIDPPFVQYDSTDEELGARVILISQEGSRDRFRGLYSVMQTLEIIPPTGERRLRDDRFDIEGVNDTIHSTARVTYARGQIKGFVLIWPAGDEARRSRVLERMLASFQTTDATLDPSQFSPSEQQSIDLISGLAIRKPLATATGVFADPRG
ncbi:MAG: peptidoglycan-binding protein, partial [Shimia sp.]